ncbi:MAG TPA: phage portal protein [Actinomycetes bacterium]|nr:phage portal protein [Actinomycetes bacterium]
MRLRERLAGLFGFGADPPAASFGMDVPGDLWAAMSAGGAIAPRISRAEALQVPAVARARNLICGTVGSLPLVTIGPDLREVPGTYLLGGNIDPEIPNSVLVAYTLEDLVFEGIAWWRVTRVGWHGYPTQARWVPTSAVHVSPAGPAQPSQMLVSPDQPFPTDGQVFIDGIPVPDSEVVRFDSPNPPLLRHAARAIRTALLLDSTAGLYAESPQPLTVFTPRDGSADVGSEEEVQRMLDRWEHARSRRATGYVGAALNLDTVGWSPEQLQLADARQHAVLEIARATGVDPEDLGVSTTSRTYANAETRRRDLVDFTLSAYISALQDRLSMRDVLPRGYQAKVRLDAFLRSDTKTRMDTYKVGLEVGAYTTEEIRVAEDRPALARGQGPAALPEPEPQPAEEPNMDTDRNAASFDQQAEPDHPLLSFDDPDAYASFRVNEAKRTISGMVVPWHKIAVSGGQRWRFFENSLRWTEASRIKLNMGHDRMQTIGAAIHPIRQNSQGLDITFRVAKVAEGDRALELADSKAWDGLSIEIDFEDEFGDEWQTDPNDRSTRLVRQAKLMGVALTPMPAFDDARVAAVAASKDPTEGRGNGPQERQAGPGRPGAPGVQVRSERGLIRPRSG